MFLKNRNIIIKMKISKVTDYAALNVYTKVGEILYICTPDTNVSNGNEILTQIKDHNSVTNKQKNDS